MEDPPTLVEQAQTVQRYIEVYTTILHETHDTLLRDDPPSARIQPTFRESDAQSQARVVAAYTQLYTQILKKTKAALEDEGKAGTEGKARALSELRIPQNEDVLQLAQEPASPLPIAPASALSPLGAATVPPPAAAATAAPPPASTEITYEYVVEKSKWFQENRVAFPTTANRIETIVNEQQPPGFTKQTMESDINGVRPVALARLRPLFEDFLAAKRGSGSAVEKQVYNGLDATGLMTRLLTKRPIVFFLGNDTALMRTKGDVADERGAYFDRIGADGVELEGFQLKDYMSYDEMALSALIGVSTPTVFINNGNRKNKGLYQYEGKPFTPRGVFVALVGARFERPGRMEFKHMVVTAEQNTPANGYGPSDTDGYTNNPVLAAWAKFYYGKDDAYFPTFEDAQRNPNPAEFFPFAAGTTYINIRVYKRRIAVAAETLLREAHARAQAEGQKAYVHIVGLGLGVWQLINEQEQWFYQQFLDTLGELRHHDGAFLSDAILDFSWFDHLAPDTKEVVHGVTVKNSQRERNPADPVPDGYMLIASYAWDSNSYPGNEYWLGELSLSGDPAAASCSTIPELQNPEINPRAAEGKYTLWHGAEGGAAVEAA